MAIVRSGFQNYRKWLHNPRYWIIAALLLIFSSTVSVAFCDVARASDTRLSCWMLPFLLYDRYLQFCIALCLIMLFCDAPFLDNLQPYCLQRLGRTRWFLGQMVYILSCSLLFFLFAWFCLILLCSRRISWTPDWGSCLQMLAHDNPFWGAFAPELIIGRSAILTTLQTLLMGTLVAGLFGALLLFLNLHYRRQTGALIAGAFSVFDFFLNSYFDELPFLFWLSPISWINPQQYVGGNFWKFGVRIGIIIAATAILSIGSMHRLRTCSIETEPEI